jgi:uncharacterized small protein (DUF1192 family)
MTDQKRIEERVARLLEAQQDKHKIKALQAEVERLKAAFGPTIELLESLERFFSGRVFLKAAPIVGATAINSELARLKAIVKKGTE